jgi:hypothetical protein
VNKGKGEKAIDVSAFFRKTKLDISFEKFWESKTNPYKDSVEIKIEKFKQEMENIDIEP